MHDIYDDPIYKEPIPKNITVKNRKAFPVLYGYIYEIGQKDYVQIAVWCPFCKRRHLHGWHRTNPIQRLEHRIQHCDKEAYFPAGYFIGIDPNYKKYSNCITQDL